MLANCRAWGGCGQVVRGRGVGFLLLPGVRIASSGGNIGEEFIGKETQGGSMSRISRLDRSEVTPERSRPS